MIPGGKPMKIKGFFYSDRRGEGLGMTIPMEGQEFLGIPYGWNGTDSQPYIEITVGGKVVQTVNCADVAMIEFERD
jgi:hypothetical protein